MAFERGFTLLELLVALVITALALGVLFHGASDGLQSVAVANRYQEALARARSRLATVGHGLALAPLHQSGDDGSGFHWQVDIALSTTALPLHQSSDEAPSPALRMGLYAVQVSEWWGSETGATHSGGRYVRLETKRVGMLP